MAWCIVGTAVYQLAFAEALAQLALFPAGKTALLTFDSTDGSVVASLEAVVEVACLIGGGG